MGLKQGPMRLADIELLLIEAAKLSNHRNFVIAGSLSVLGAVMLNLVLALNHRSDRYVGVS